MTIDTTGPELVINVGPLLHRRWVCQIVRTGYHNGAGCRASEPHHGDDWGCGWRFEMSIDDTPENRELLGITSEIARAL